MNEALAPYEGKRIRGLRGRVTAFGRHRARDTRSDKARVLEFPAVQITGVVYPNGRLAARALWVRAGTAWARGVRVGARVRIAGRVERYESERGEDWRLRRPHIVVTEEGDGARLNFDLDDRGQPAVLAPEHTRRQIEDLRGSLRQPRGVGAFISARAAYRIVQDLIAAGGKPARCAVEGCWKFRRHKMTVHQHCAAHQSTPFKPPKRGVDAPMSSEG